MSLQAKKSLGQNFLHDGRALNQIVAAANLTTTDNVLEIGPGKGALTEQLLTKAGKVTAIELDDRMIPYLTKKFATEITDNRLQLIHGDALKCQFPVQNYKVVANIPYYITSPLLRRILAEQHEVNNLPQLAVLLVQKEVAERICHPEKESVISLSVKMFGTPNFIAEVPPECFSPAPKVDSAIISITDIHEPPAQHEKLLKLIKQGFKAPRKKLLNNLYATLQLDKAETLKRIEQTKVDTSLRPEELKLADWINLLPYFEDRLK